MKILVDADACPKMVLQICCELGKKYDIAVWTVASFNHNIQSDHHITVESDSQAADIKVMNLSEAGDIIITQDWGLAAMVLGKHAKCLSAAGREYRSGQMEFLLEERNIKAKLRRSGGRTKGPRKRTGEDDRRFAASLEKLLARHHIEGINGSMEGE
ncbi:MAG: DUF188 domain-containing protein [Negativicutes bacterium]